MPEDAEIAPEDVRESRQGSASTAQSPSVRSGSNTRLKKLRSRPHLRKRQSLQSSKKLVFSVDDAINDAVEDDTDTLTKADREYLEGYSDALRSFYIKKRGGQPPHSSYFPPVSESRGDDEAGNASLPEFAAQARGRQVRSPDAAQAEILNKLKSAEQELAAIDSVGRDNDEINDETGITYDDDDGESVVSNSSGASSSTVGSLDLKKRQDAINSTHPFGIKIWKPSLYKKKRSVATRAEEDIHQPHKPIVSWGVRLTNFVWSMSFGLFLYLVCVLGGIVVFVLSFFAINRQLRGYVKLLFSLGRYLLSPFGKFVLLNKDSNYIDEDELDGRSISEFHRWREQEEGRLFFAPPRRLTNTHERRPLLKDHKGRPLGEAYSSLEGTSQSQQEQSQQDNEAVDTANGDDGDDERAELDIKVRFFGRGSWSSGRLVFYLFFYGILQPAIWMIGAICWLFVFTIPMFNVAGILCDHLRRHPLALHFESEKEYYRKSSADTTKKGRQLIILSTYRCCGLHYYKFTIDGTNIFFINLLALVIFVIVDYFLLFEQFGWNSWITDSTVIFFMCLLAIIPLAYFIGQAVASISAQSSMGVGAVINAFFSTVVEIFLYCVALNQKKGKLVEGSMIGSILGGVLLLPGLSMCGGALKRKTQRYNPRSAGVSSTMLLYAMVIMFAPSLFYQIYGAYEIRCRSCDLTKFEDDCTQCRFIQPSFSLDSLYYSIIEPFSLTVAVALFLAYVCGLFFTLRTHASLIWATNSHEQQAMNKREENYLRTPSVISLNSQPKGKQKLPEGVSSVQSPSVRKPAKPPLPSPQVDVPRKRHSHPREVDFEEEEIGGHDAPNWSRNKSVVILLGATLLYAIIAEILVDTVDAVLVNFSIDSKFLGLTVFALVPNTTEFLNAISFAVGGNVALSMEIGSAYALQVVLIQIPSLVLFSVYRGFDDVNLIFSLVFPRWDIIATLISIYLFTYIYAEGKSNYFKGVILILIYVVVMIGFWFNGVIESLDDGYTGGPRSIF